MSHTNKGFTPDSSMTESESVSSNSSEYYQNQENERISNGNSMNGGHGKNVGPGWANMQNVPPINNHKEISTLPSKVIMDDKPKMDGKDYLLELLSNENPIGTWINSALVIVLVWGSLACILGSDAMPGGNLFSLVIVFGCAVVGGKLVSLVNLPPLLGMLVAGILLRSIPVVNVVGDNVDRTWSSVIRSIALVIILIRAGLGLNPQKLKELSFVMFRLALIPCLVEMATVAVASYLLLGLPWLWGILLGFALSAVSPAVVVPGMLTLSEQGLGVEKGIPTLVMAAGSVEDVFAIAGFTVMLGITVTSTSLTWQILQGPCDIIIGIIYGIIAGYIAVALHYRPKASGVYTRFLILLGFGLVALFGSKKAKFSGAGALGCLVMAFVSGSVWRNGGSDEKKLSEKFAALWNFIQHFVFGLIGAEIDLMSLDGKTVGLGIVIIVIGTTLRCLCSLIVVMGRDFTFKERVFIALTKIPKATVQASIGSIALDYARRFAADTDNAESFELYGSQVLILSVLIILFSAPLGAGIIQLTGAKLLKPNESDLERKA